VREHELLTKFLIPGRPVRREVVVPPGSACLNRALGLARNISNDMTPADSFSFSKDRRLTKASEYKRVKRDGLARRGKLLMLNVVPVENSGPCRVGVVTSRHVGGAVVRNRLRRRMREIVRQHQHELRGSFWIVLVAGRDATNASYQQLEDEWLRLAKRASILL